MPKTILAPTAAAAFTESITLRDASELPVSLSATGLTGTEAATLQFHDGTAFRDFFDNSVVASQLSSSTSLLTIYAPGVWRVSKPITASPVSINLHWRNNP